MKQLDRKKKWCYPTLEGFGNQPLFLILEIAPSLHVSVWVVRNLYLFFS